MADSFFLICLGLVVGSCIWISLNKTRHLPPGPSGIPLLGNLFQVDAKRPFIQFHEWAKQYGPIYTFRMGQQRMVVLNTPQAVEELFVKRGKDFSSRPVPHVAQDIMSRGQRMVFLPFSKHYVTVRKCVHSVLGGTPSREKRYFQDLESRVLLHDLLRYEGCDEKDVCGDGKVPESHWFALFRRYSTTVVMLTSYGKRIQTIQGNGELHKIYDAVENCTTVSQLGRYMADAFPVLRYLPDILAPWRPEARKLHEWEMGLWGSLLRNLQNDMASGIKRHNCLIETYIRQRAEAGYGTSVPGLGLTDNGWLRDTALAYAAATVLEAGSEPTVGAMETFILFMLANPEVLKRLREEIDSVVGSERMPTFEDEKKLPYLIACIKETLRIRPPLLTGIPHLADEDTIYEGYLIPKGTSVVGNIWTLHMDPERYPDPTSFIPERFMKGSNEKQARWASGPDSDRDHFAFGWGRRFCQGSLIAEASLFIVLSRVIWGLEFNGRKDADTAFPDPMDEYATWTEGFVSTPKPFEVEFKPRSAKHAQIITDAYEQTQHEWETLGLAKDER